MRHIDLFSGIGGFALAAKIVWGSEYENICFCDNNKFCCEVIKKNFGKESLIYEDIREVTKERIIADTKGKRQLSKQEFSRKGIFVGNENKVDLLTGGFPCQPFSAAGKRRGTEDDRYLWPEMYRVIQDTQPEWIIAENVRGILNIDGGVVFEQVCADLETASYEVQPFIIPACAVNAPHRRDRVWIVAHAGCFGQTKQEQQTTRGIECSSDAPDTAKRRLQECGAEGEGGQNSQRRESPKYVTPDGVIVTDTRNKQGGADTEGNERTGGWDSEYTWDTPWLEVATEFCRVDDGLPVTLDGFKFTKAGHRVERLKALGNAIVPQVAVEIMKAIKCNS